MRMRITGANRCSSRPPVMEVPADRTLSGSIKSRGKQVRQRVSHRLDIRNGSKCEELNVSKSSLLCIAERCLMGRVATSLMGRKWTFEAAQKVKIVSTLTIYKRSVKKLGCT
jgi:hypothetical protein